MWVKPKGGLSRANRTATWYQGPGFQISGCFNTYVTSMLKAAHSSCHIWRSSPRFCFPRAEWRKGRRGRTCVPAVFWRCQDTGPQYSRSYFRSECLATWLTSHSLIRLISVLPGTRCPGKKQGSYYWGKGESRTWTFCSFWYNGHGVHQAESPARGCEDGTLCTVTDSLLQP